jgi:hypothetical protein
LRTDGNAVLITDETGTKVSGRFFPDSLADLWYNGSQKFKTENTGVRVYGNIVVSGTVDGVDIATNIPSTLGTAGQVLTVNSGGTAGEWADAGGGGSALELYAENPSTPTAPSASGTNAIAIGDGASATNNYSLAIGGTASASNSTAVAIGYGATASSGSSLALGRAASATTGGFNTALGYNAVAAGSGGNATALTNSYASGADSFAAAITNNTSSYGATGANSIAMGYQAKATGSTNGSVAIGHNAQATSRETVAIGSSAYASGSGGVALGGYFGSSNQARATGTASFAVAGYNGVGGSTDTTAAGLGSIAMAGGYAQQNQSVAIGAFAHANVRGKVAWSSYPLTNSYGATQSGNYVLSNSTTDATATKLVTDYDWTSAGSINQIVLPNNSCYGFTGTVIARENSAQTNDFAVWEVKGGAVRGASASTTALGSYNINVVSKSTGAANWDIALSADTTNGAVAITVTGEASHNIRWVATINTTEVIY